MPPTIVMGVLVVLLSAGLAPAAPTGAPPDVVTVTRLDGTAVSGVLTGWSEGEVVIQTADGEQHVASDELVSLLWPKDSAAAPQKPIEGMVELTDGTVLPTADFAVADNKASLTLGAELPADEKRLSIPVRQIAAVRLRTLEPPVAAQWEEIRGQNLPADVMVVMDREGKSLDHVEGVFGDVTPEKIAFKFDDEPLRVDRAKVAGLIYYRGTPQDVPEPRCVLHGHSGLRANAAAAQIKDRMLHVTTASGVSFKWPLNDIYLADFSAGKILYLSDVEPAAEKWTPLIGLPGGAELAANLGKLRRDRSAYGGSLSLYVGASDASGAFAQLRSFEKGLAIRSRTELVYRVPADFRRFVAIAGIEPATSTTGNVRLVIHADDKPLYDSDIVGTEPPKKIDLDVTGAKRLKIAVEFGQNLDTGDWLNLCDARLSK